MKGVTFDVSVPRYLLARSLGKLTTSVLFGRLSRVRLEDVEEPSLPGPEWAKLRVLSCGICGTDISNLTYSASPALEPFGSCRVRGYAPDQICPSCRQGLHCTCEMAGEEGPLKVGPDPGGREVDRGSVLSQMPPLERFFRGD